MDHCARLRLYWHNGQYIYNLVHLHGRICWSPVTTLCHFTLVWRRLTLYRVLSSLTHFLSHVRVSGNDRGQVVHAHVSLSPSSIILYQSPAAMSCDLEGNRRSGVALAMRHRLKWFIHLRAQGLSKGDENPTNTPHPTNTPDGVRYSLPIFTYVCGLVA